MFSLLQLQLKATSVRVFAYSASGSDTNYIKINYNSGSSITKTAADLGIGNLGDKTWFDMSPFITGEIDIDSIEYGSYGGGGQLGNFEINGVNLIDGLNDPTGYGVNGFYLPMDGNTPVGKDCSGRGNDWEVTYSINSELTKTSGAKPILNTIDGSYARKGVFSDDTNEEYEVTVAAKSGGGGNAYYIDGAERPALTNLVRGATYKFDLNSNTTDSHPFRFGAAVNGSEYTDGVVRSINDGREWSANFTGSVNVNQPTPTFDGRPPEINGYSHSGDAMTINFSPVISGRIVVYAGTGFSNPNSNACTYTLSDGSNLSSILGYTGGAGPYWEALDFGEKTNISSLACSAGYAVYAITVDGVLLTDNLDDKYTAITVPDDAPDTLYYYCDSHPGMGNSLGLITDEGKADPYASKCILAVPFLSGTEDVSNQYNGTSIQKDVRSNGTPFSILDSNYYGSSRNYSVGDGSTWHSMPDIGTDDFTVEFWIQSDTSTADSVFRRIISTGPNGLDQIQIGHIGSTASSGGYISYTHSDNNNFAMNTNINVTDGEWHHVAVVRDSGTVYCYVDGCVGDDTDADANSKSSSLLYLSGYGGISSGSGRFDGRIQDLRIYKGVAKYTENFVPASANPTILNDAPSGVSGKTAISQTPYGSTSFSTSPTPTNVNYLEVPDSSDFTFGSDDWTMECYAKLNKHDSASYNGLVMKYFSDRPSSSWYWAVYNVGSTADPQYRQVFYMYVGGVEYSSTGNVDSALAWNHYAVSRDGDNIYGYLNGKRHFVIDVTGLSMNDSAVDVTIGCDGNQNARMVGHISNARVVKGSSLYPGGRSFKVSQEPLTVESQGAVANEVVLLACQSNTDALAVTRPSTTAGVNAGRNWEQYILGTPDSSYPLSNLFNGTIGAGFASGTRSTNPGTLTLDTSSLNITVTNVRLSTNAAGSGHSNYTINGNALGDPPTGDSTNVYAVNGQLNTIAWSYDNANGPYIYMRGIEVDLDDGNGYQLLFNDIIGFNNVQASTFNPFDKDVNTLRPSGATVWPTFNPLQTYTQTLSDFNLSCNGTAGAAVGSLFAKSGKWYWEVTAGTDYTMVGIQRDDTDESSYPGERATQFAYYGNQGSGLAYSNNSSSTYGDGFFENDVIGVAMDLDTPKLEFYVNGIYQGVAFGPETNFANYPGYYSATCRSGSGAFNGDSSINFGQKPLRYSPPAGYQLLNSSSLRGDNTLPTPSSYCKVSTWTGNDNVRHILTGMEPDLVWVKNLISANQDHVVTDSVRGGGFKITPNQTFAQTSGANDVTSFDPLGFYVGADGRVNASGSNYRSWSWQAGGSNGTFNVDGNGYADAQAAGITGIGGIGEVPANKYLGLSVGRKQGFSIVKYNGAGGGDMTVPHGLSQTPEVVIIKNLTSAVDWAVIHAGTESNRNLSLSTTGTEYGVGFLGCYKTGLTEEHFTVNFTDTNLQYCNASNDDYIAYLWHSVPGYSKVGFWTNTTDGQFIPLDFKPAVILIKCTDTGENWYLFDNVGHPINEASPSVASEAISGVQPNTENTVLQSQNSCNTATIDFLSNGFKMRTSNSGDGELTFDNRRMCYIAWAEQPNLGLYGSQAGAR